MCVCVCVCVCVFACINVVCVEEYMVCMCRVLLVEVHVKGYQYTMGVADRGLYHCPDKSLGFLKSRVIVLLHVDNMADSVFLYPRQVADGSPGVSLFCRLLHQDNTRTVH